MLMKIQTVTLRMMKDQPKNQEKRAQLYNL